jgi:hypothetical protein
MSGSDSPSAYWTREHGTKRIYTDPFTADREAIKLTEDRAGTSHHGPDAKWEAYPCSWGRDYRDGRTATGHWHVGRPGRRHRS